MTKTWGQQNDEARSALAEFFAKAREGETFTAAQAGFLAGARFAAYTADALMRAVDRLVADGVIVQAGWRAGAAAYRRSA